MQKTVKQGNVVTTLTCPENQVHIPTIKVIPMRSDDATIKVYKAIDDSLTLLCAILAFSVFIKLVEVLKNK